MGNSDRQKANLLSFDFVLSDEEMAEIDALDGEVQAQKPDPNHVDMIFENKSPEQLNIFWVPQKGDEVETGRLEPRVGKLSMQSYHNHKFHLRLANGQLAKALVINNKN